MSMTTAQAKQLGTLIAKARARKDLTVRGLADLVGVNYSWIAQLEAGHYMDPSPDRLARLSEVLEIAPARIDRIARGAVADSLPGMRTYFRAKYDLTPEEAARVERYVQRLRRNG